MAKKETWVIIASAMTIFAGGQWLISQFGIVSRQVISPMQVAIQQPWPEVKIGLGIILGLLWGILVVSIFEQATHLAKITRHKFAALSLEIVGMLLFLTLIYGRTVAIDAYYGFNNRQELLPFLIPFVGAGSILTGVIIYFRRKHL